jgi:uncharacterized protein YndB with AHSA1/START domain
MLHRCSGVARNATIEAIRPLLAQLRVSRDLALRVQLRQMKRLEFGKVIDAPIESVWAAITDHEGMSEWSPMKRVVVDPKGAPDPNGLGAIRHMKGAGPTIVEEVVEWSPPNEYAYRLRAGAPIRDHKGVVQLTREGNTTRVRWIIEFRPKIPGTGFIIVGILRRAVGGMLSQLKKKLETQD